jgi:L-lactate utilization protein LutC
MARRVESNEPPEAISREMGLALPEVTRIMAQQDFRSFLSTFRKEVYKDTDTRLAKKFEYLNTIENKLTKHAVEILDQIREIAMNKDANDNARLKACIYWLSMAGVKGIQSGEEDNKLNPAMITQLQVVLNESQGVKAKLMGSTDVRVESKELERVD